MKLLQIVPRQLNSRCGVTNYATILGNELRRQHAIDSEYLVAGHCGKQSNALDVKTSVIYQQNHVELVEAIESTECDIALLQFSNYGYHRRGVPRWLDYGLRSRRFPLITMFHELFASGPITSSSFWLSPWMKATVRSIKASSDHCVTNRDLSAEWLGGRPPVVPVFSNLGEMRTFVPFDQRQNWIAFFPYQAVNDKAYWRGLHEAARRLQPDLLVALGNYDEPLPNSIENCRVRRVGVLAAAEVSELMSTCRFGYLSYPPLYLGKSGILACFAAHGCSVLTSKSLHTLSEGLEFGKHFPTLSQTIQEEDHEPFGFALREWYRGHDVAETANTFARIIRNTI